MRSTLVGKLGHTPVEHNLVDKLACMKMCIVAVVVERRRFEPVAVQHKRKSTLADKLEHMQPEHKMADKMAYKTRHTGSVGSVERRQLVVGCCYSCFQSIRWYRMEDKLACMMEHIAAVMVVVERR